MSTLHDHPPLPLAALSRMTRCHDCNICGSSLVLQITKGGKAPGSESCQNHNPPWFYCFPDVHNTPASEWAGKFPALTADTIKAGHTPVGLWSLFHQNVAALEKGSSVVDY
ncbi:hypothetical protein DFH07DRAFT_966452 [Mycena maculata]|uniref:Uncharacterized protein n=1 Tax=Mycena maculata TaxID=230809 RepID=A0AAD7I8U7_9AGAR|nr:hypothetical protein DFH07DRAFT_966452 [Mycena maculata]